MKTTPITAVVLSLALNAFTAFAAVTVTNVTAVVSPGKVVTISYDLASPSALTNAVGVSISTNGGATFFSTCTNFTGAVGNNVAPGTTKQIFWGARYDTLPTNNYPLTRVRVLASDSMALIPAGPFQMGTNNLPYESEMADAGPNHTVTLSAFFMDKHEVTSQQWFEVRNWALTNGYAFGAGSGKGALHPVQTVNWFDCVKWCNARSEKEGLTPCYYTNAAQTLVYRGGSANLSNEWVNWSANGYRLPTEAEWEKAARGGAVGMRFPWSDANTITNSRANYCSDTYFAYDLGPDGYNPLFTPGDEPYTSPVGYFAPNGYGLYDLAGNVWEW
ncbi:MAG: formylglycine-generating enzyme family protein, partial [bacterium]|nr:formylglycine-generating enzyme family protein [bacterium]